MFIETQSRSKTAYLYRKINSIIDTIFKAAPRVISTPVVIVFDEYLKKKWNMPFYFRIKKNCKKY